MSVVTCTEPMTKGQNVTHLLLGNILGFGCEITTPDENFSLSQAHRQGDETKISSGVSQSPRVMNHSKCTVPDPQRTEWCCCIRRRYQMHGDSADFPLFVIFVGFWLNFFINYDRSILLTYRIKYRKIKCMMQKSSINQQLLASWLYPFSMRSL